MGVCKIRGKWAIDYYFQGRRIREVVGTNRRQAERALAARKGEIVQGKFNLHMVKPTPYFEDFAKEYLEWAKNNHRSWERMDAVCVRALLNCFKGKRLHEITPWLIEKFKLKRKEEVKPATINRELAVLSSIFSRAIEWGKLAEHPMKGGRVKKFREESFKERILSEEEEKRLLDACSGWFKDFVVMAVDTGMRLSELINLRREDVDLKNGVVRVRNTKSGRDRKIALTDRVISILKKIERCDEDNEYIFPHGKGEMLWAVRSAFLRACKRANLQGLRFHDLRHTFATRLVTAGIDLVTVQRLLGHQNIQMTMRYSHPGSEEIRRAVKVLEENARSSQQMDSKEKINYVIASLTH